MREQHHVAQHFRPLEPPALAPKNGASRGCSITTERQGEVACLLRLLSPNKHTMTPCCTHIARLTRQRSCVAPPIMLRLPECPTASPMNPPTARTQPIAIQPTTFASLLAFSSLTTATGEETKYLLQGWRGRRRLYYCHSQGQGSKRRDIYRFVPHGQVVKRRTASCGLPAVYNAVPRGGHCASLYVLNECNRE